MWDIDNVPHRWAKEQIVSGRLPRDFFLVLMVCLFGIQESGDFVHSFSSQHLRPDDGHVVDGEEEDIIKWAGGALYFGGADTVRTLRWIFRRLTDDDTDRSLGPIVHSSHDAVP